MSTTPTISFSPTRTVQVDDPNAIRARPPRDIDIPTYIEDPEHAQLRESLLQTTDLGTYTTTELCEMFWHIRDYAYFCGIHGNYDQMLECEKLGEYIRTELDDRGEYALANIVTDPFKLKVQRQDAKSVFFSRQMDE
jgi:hypothetical protein